MGSFYTSHVVRGPSQTQILALLTNRSAYVSRTEQSITVVLDEASESQDGDELAALALKLSATFHCPVLALLNHDDDVLYFQLYENGRKTDEYDSDPAYFGDDGPHEPTGGNAVRLAAAFGAADVMAIESALRKTDYVFATDRHHDLAVALGLPEFSVGIGYTYADAGDSPPWGSDGAYTRTSTPKQRLQGRRGLLRF